MRLTTHVIDIETIPLPADQREYGRPTDETMKYGNTKDPAKREVMLEKAVAGWDEGADCALKAEYGQIALIGYQRIDSKRSGEIEVFMGSESEILQQFWDKIRGITVQHRIAGHNLQSFDIPYIIRRSMILGVGCRADMDTLKRHASSYNSELLFDTMRQWQCGDRQTYIKLETLCHAFGVTVTPQDVCGKEFYKWWAKDPQKCVEYLINDIRMTSALCQAMGA